MQRSFINLLAALAAALFILAASEVAALTAGVTAPGSTGYSRDAFARVGACPAPSGENDYTCGVIDEANGYAYFGTNTSPGKIAKIALNGLGQAPSRVAVITLNGGENNLTSAVIDTANGYAYFGTNTAPGIVVKVALGAGSAAPSRVGAVSLSAGENYLKSAGIDAANGYAYFGTYTSPGIVVKVVLGSGSSAPSRTGAVTFPAGENLLSCAVINAPMQYAWFGTYTAPGMMVKVDLGSGAAAPTRYYSIPFNTGEDNLINASIDVENETGYFVTGTTPSSIVIADLYHNARDTAIVLDSGESPLSCGVFDSQRQTGFWGTNTTPSKAIKTVWGMKTASLTLSTGENNAHCAVMDSTNGCVYLGTGASPASVVKLKSTQIEHVRSLGGAKGFVAKELSTAMSDPVNGYAYFLSDNGNPGVVAKVTMTDDDTTPVRVSETVFLEGEDNTACSVIDRQRGYAYYGTLDGKVIKTTLGSGTNPPVRIGAIQLTGAEQQTLHCAFIDETNGYVYFVASTYPSVMHKLSVGTGAALPTSVGSVTFNSGENDAQCGAIDTTHGYAYVAGYTNGYIVKVALGSGDNPPTRAGGLSITEDLLTCAVLDPANGYGYFGVETSYGSDAQVIKIALGAGLAPPTRIGSVNLPYIDILRAAIIDTANQYAYFAGGASAHIAKVSLGTGTSLPTVVANTSLPLDFAQNRTLCMAADIANGYAYVGAYTNPASIFKVNLGAGAAAPSLVSTLNLGQEESGFIRLMLEPSNGHAYTLSPSGAFAKFSLGGGIDPPARIGSCLGLSSSQNAFVDAPRGIAYIVNYMAIVEKISLGDGANPPTYVNWKTLSWKPPITYNAAYDATTGYIYLATAESPSKIYKVQYGGDSSPLLNNLGVLTLNSGENNPFFSVLDSANGYAYFLTNTTPAKIVKVALGAGTATPTRVGVLNLDAADGRVGTPALDAEHGYIYALSGVDVGSASEMQILKIAVGAGGALPTRIGAVKIAGYASMGGGAIALDTANGLGYVSMDNTIVKFSLGAGSAQPSVVGTFSIPGAENGIYCGALDPATGHVYLGAASFPSVFHKYALSWKDAVHGTKITLANEASVTDVRLYSHAAGGNVRMAIYDDNGSARSLKWQSGSIANTQTNGWITSAISSGTPSSLILYPGTYWLAFNTDTTNYWESYAGSNSGGGFELSQLYGAFSSSITNSAATTMNGVFSQYMTYTPVCLLTVASAYDSPVPAAGVTVIDYNALVLARVTSPVSGGAGMQYVCTGYTGTGSASSGSGTSYNFSILQDTTLTWNWKTQYQLTATSSPAAGGSITPANGTWIDAGTVQSVRATNNTGWQFDSWSGALSGSANPQNLTMNSAKSVTASFKPQLAIVSAHGSPSPAVGTTYPNYNSTVSASVMSPVSGGAGIQYVCTGYTGSGSAPSGTGTSCSFTITQPSTITWNWKTQYQLTTSVLPPGSGTITPPNGAWVEAGASANCTAYTNANWRFLSWSGALGGSTNPQWLTMNAPKSITANFGLQLTVASSYGSPTPAVGTSYPAYNSTISASVTSPVSGGTGVRYVCTGFTGTGSAPSGSATSCSFTITQPSTLTWNWKTQYLLTPGVYPVSGGTMTPAAETWIDSGTVQEVQASNNTGWQFASWSGSLSGTANPYSAAMTAPKTITANFNPQLAVTSAHSSPSPNGTSYPEYGSTVNASVLSPVLTEDVNARYFCTGYTGTGDAPSGSGTSCSFTLNQPSSINWNWNLQFLFKYQAGAHGSITGNTSQWVDLHADGSEVVAVADPGYSFVKWTDGVMTAARTDANAVVYVAATAIFAGAAPSSSLLPVADSTIVGTTTTLPFVTVDGSLGKGIASTSLWVKAPGSGGFLEWGGSATPGTSGSFDFDFYMGNGRYEFATKAMDNDGNAEDDPAAAEVVLIVNTLENGAYTYTISSADETCTFPMTNTLDMIISLHNANPGGTLTVSRTVAHTGPPAFQDANHLINEHLTITPWLLGGDSAIITWNYDPANQNGLVGPLNTVFNVQGGSMGMQYSVAPTAPTLVIPNVNDLYGDWYAGNPYPPSRNLTVASAHGAPNPPVGENHILEGAEVVCSVASPVAGAADVQYVCTGFDMPVYSWHGNDTICTFTIYQNVDLTWNWKTQYQFAYSPGAGGSISGAASQWIDAGQSGSEVTAVPAGGYQFVKWSDNVMTASRTDAAAAAPLAVTAIFEDAAPPTSILTPLSDTTLAGSTIELPFIASDADGGSGVTSTTLWVKSPGAGVLAAAGIVRPGASGTFSYSFAAGDGLYEFATQSRDAAGNIEDAPVTSTLQILVNIAPNSTFTQMVHGSDETRIFPMTNSIDILITISGAAPGGTITVSRAEGATYPAGYDPANFLNESLTITSTGLGTGWTAMLTWNFDPANDSLGAALNTLYQFDGPGNYTRRWTITPSDSTIIVPGITSFSDWYAGELVAPSEIGDWTLMR